MSKSVGSSLKIILDHFFTISVFWLLLLRVFLFLGNFHFFTISVLWLLLLRVFLLLGNVHIFSYLFAFFNFTRTMKIITGRRHWVLTVESPRLTTKDDNNSIR